jgi:cyclopropane-fatty-acyl-phospholipid synthase
LIRIGIRCLLGSRLREINAQRGGFSTDDFLDATGAQPIAIAADKANDQHYEVPAEFFHSALGRRLKYSCCYWSDQTESLDQAEENALRITCEHAQLEDGMDILELGCGWGSLSLWMAERFPESRITAVSNSHSQRSFIQDRADEAGVTNLTMITADMNDFESQASFDRVVSVEMFEHMRNHRRLMDRIHDWLRPGGKLFVHVFCHRDTPYLFRTDGEHNWMGRYFFSGGMMPSADLLQRCGSRLELDSNWKWNGDHYAKTCRAWLENQDRDRRSLRELFAQTYGDDGANVWFHRWRLFFMACEELFAYRGGQEWFVSHYLFARCPRN